MGVPAGAALKALEAVERELSTLYAWFADVFAADRELAAVFFQLARDERSHQILVQYQQRMARADPGTFGPVVIDLGLVRELTTQITSFRRRLPNPSPADALKAAIGFETHAADHLHRTAVAAAATGFAELVGKLGEEDSERCETLARLLRNRSGA